MENPQTKQESQLNESESEGETKTAETATPTDQEANQPPMEGEAASDTPPAENPEPASATSDLRSDGDVADVQADETEAGPIDISSIDAIEFAAATAHMTAARLFALLRYGGAIEMAHQWYLSDVNEAGAIDQLGLDIRGQVMGLAAYVCEKRVTLAEQLYLYARINLGIRHGADSFQEEPFDVKHAWGLFQETCLSVYSGIVREQKRLEHAVALEQHKPAPLAREDSIFEDVDQIGDLVPGAAEASQQIRQVQIDQAKRAQAAKLEAAAADNPGVMSAGETVAKPPVNKGGRGRKKKAAPAS